MKLKHNNYNRLYRKPVNRKRIWKILLVLAVALLAAALTGFWGNELRRRAAEQPIVDPALTVTTTEEKSDDPIRIPAASEHTLLSLPASALADADSYHTSLDALPACDGILLALYNGKKAAWHSDAAAAIYGTGGDGALTARELISPVKERRLYAAALFETSVFSASTPAERNARLGYEQLLISELYELGLNEVTLDGVPMNADAVPVLSEYCDALRANCPGITVSLVISRGLGDTDSGQMLLSRFASVFDRLSLDLSAALASDLAGENRLAAFPALTEACNAELLPISRFGMQLLLRVPATVSYADCTDALFPALTALSFRTVAVLFE